MSNIIIGFKIMGQGMLGIFVTIILIMVVITLIQKLTSSFGSKEKEN